MSQKNLLLLLVFVFQKKLFFIKFAINTVYTLPRTYNITSSTTFIIFLFSVKTCLQFTAFALLTTPKIRLHYSQYNIDTTSTIHLFIKLFLTCLILIAWIRKESDRYCLKNGRGSHFLL